jgi:hypothetical protein
MGAFGAAPAVAPVQSLGGRRAASALVAAAVLVAGAAGARASQQPRVVLDEPGGIISVAQAGNWLAWSRHGTVVKLRRADGGATTVFAVAGGSDFVPVTVAGPRALWTSMAIGNNVEGYVETGVAGSRTVRVLAHVTSGAIGDSTGVELGGIAGGGTTLLFSVVDSAIDDPSTCDAQGYRCTIVYRGGGVWRLAGDRKIRVPETPGAFLLAVSGGRVALVLPGTSRSPGRTVQVRELVSGRLVGESEAAAGVRAIGISPSLVAVLVGNAKGPKRIEWHGPAAATALGTLALPPQAGDDLSVSGRRILFRVGRQLRLLDTRTRTSRTVAVGQRTPFSPSIEGDRVLWAENTHTGSVLRTVNVG